MSKKNKLTKTSRLTKFHSLRNELLDLSRKAMIVSYRAGEILKEVRDKELWEGQYGSFAEFYSDPEIGYRSDNVSRAIKLVENFKMDEVVRVPLRKVYAILPHVTKQNKKEMVEMATALSYGDLRHQLTVKRLAEVDKKAAKAFQKTYPCTQCGGVRGVTWEMLCHCGWTPELITHIGKLIDSVTLGGDIFIPKEVFEDEEGCY